MRLLTVLLLLMMSTLLFAIDAPTKTVAAGDTLRLAFVGDIMVHASQISGALTASGDYDFGPSFRQVAPILSAADLAIGNLETVCATSPPTGYPRFNAPVSLLDALADAGFDVLSLANNHSCDQGGAGLEQTLAATAERRLHTIGVDGRQPLVVEVNGAWIWLAAYTYGSNLAAKGDVAPAMLDAERIRADLAAAVADYRIVMLHWGVEYRRRPSAEQVTLADSLLAWGADAIIGSHPHVIQPLRHDERGLVAYSLGNFISAQREGNPGVRWTEDGVILVLTLQKSADGLRLAAVDTLPTWVHRRRRTDGSWRYAILPTSFATDMEKDPLRSHLEQSERDTRQALAQPMAKPCGQEVLDGTKGLPID
ncbi:MAG: CapA family protein [Candidatus Cloacimonetes bacterium]|nr:CapA family protein [Candidatus Cloacimonadota bacterium]